MDMPLPLRIETRHVEPDITVVELIGKITMAAEIRRIEGLIEDLIEQGGKKVVFDLAAVDYIDSSGMGTIAHCFTRMAQSGGGLRIASLKERVKQLFKITRLDTILPSYESAAAACADFTVPAKSGAGKP